MIPLGFWASASGASGFFYDTFTGANGPLVGHTPDIGDTWSLLSGGSGSITNNAYRAGSGASDDLVQTVVTNGPANFSLSATFKSFQRTPYDGTHNQGRHIAVSVWAGSLNIYIQAMTAYNDITFTPRHTLSWSATGYAGGSVNYTFPAVGATYIFSYTFINEVLTFFINGAQVGTFTVVAAHTPIDLITISSYRQTSGGDGSNGSLQYFELDDLLLQAA